MDLDSDSFLTKTFRRSARRFRRMTKIRKRLRYSWPSSGSMRGVGLLSKTITPCSCFMCGNRRKFEGPLLSEKRNMDKFREQLSEIMEDSFLNDDQDSVLSPRRETL